MKRSHIFIARAGYADLLQEELADRWGLGAQKLGDDAVAFDERLSLPRFHETVFARQYLPLATPIEATDLAKAVSSIVRKLEVTSQRANRLTGRWTLHAFALDDNQATQHAAKIEKALLNELRTKLPRLYKRFIAADEIVKQPLQAHDFVVQLYVPSISTLWFSVGSFASGISPFIGGNLRMRARKGAPSRSARKIEEAFHAMGRMPRLGETAVDLGAAPGGWTFSLARRGASVTAVDCANLALPEGKALSQRVTHVRDNGLHYQPACAVDWLVCDMIVAPHETLRVLRHWLEKQWMRHFIVNLKLPKNEPWSAIKNALTLFEQYDWPIMMGRHLFHDRWEITLIGSRDPLPTAGKDITPAPHHIAQHSLLPAAAVVSPA